MARMRRCRRYRVWMVSCSCWYRALRRVVCCWSNSRRSRNRTRSSQWWWIRRGRYHGNHWIGRRLCIRVIWKLIGSLWMMGVRVHRIWHNRNAWLCSSTRRWYWRGKTVRMRDVIRRCRRWRSWLRALRPRMLWKEVLRKSDEWLRSRRSMKNARGRGTTMGQRGWRNHRRGHWVKSRSHGYRIARWKHDWHWRRAARVWVSREVGRRRTANNCWISSVGSSTIARVIWICLLHGHIWIGNSSIRQIFWLVGTPTVEFGLTYPTSLVIAGPAFDWSMTNRAEKFHSAWFKMFKVTRCCFGILFHFVLHKRISILSSNLAVVSSNGNIHDFSERLKQVVQKFFVHNQHRIMRHEPDMHCKWGPRYVFPVYSSRWRFRGHSHSTKLAVGPSFWKILQLCHLLTSGADLCVIGHSNRMRTVALEKRRQARCSRIEGCFLQGSGRTQRFSLSRTKITYQLCHFLCRKMTNFRWRGLSRCAVLFRPQRYPVDLDRRWGVLPFGSNIFLSDGMGSTE